MKKVSLTQKILSKNYIVFIISVVISIVIWVYMSMNASNDTTVTIANVPIQMELSESARDLGLQIFTGEEQTASVTVTGNRAILGSVAASDVTVTAAASSANTSGNYTLPVSAAKKNPTSNFQISNSTPSSVNVTVDYYKESNFPIQDGITYSVESGYYGVATLPYSSVTVSGPQTEVMKIKKAVAVATVTGSLKESTDVEAQIVLYDANDNALSTKLMTLSVTSMTVNVAVLPEKDVYVTPAYVNKPTGLDLNDLMTIQPSSILLAGPEDVMKNVNYVTTEEIDFSKLSNEKKTFDSLALVIPEKCKNISNSSTAAVTLDLSGLSKKAFEVDSFKVTGLPSGYKSEVTSKNITVTVIGPKAQIDSLTADKITANIAVPAEIKTGSVQMPVSFTFSNADGCWAFGTYNANLTITEDK